MAENQDMKKENGILEYLNKFCRNRSGFQAVYINMQRVAENVRSAQNKKVLTDAFLPVLQKGQSKVFALPNDDILVVYDKKLQDEIDSSMVRVGFVLQEDENIRRAESLVAAGIVVFYDLGSEEADFTKKIVNACYQAPRPQPVQESRNASFFNTSTRRFRKELTPDMLAKVQKIISVADFSSFIRRQAICAVIGKSAPQRVFEEVFVSIPDMRDSLLPEVEITANPWLFLALTETLDKRVLEIISRHDDGSLIGNFSVNINVSTILSDDFLRFDDSINGSMRQSIILELQLVDIFSDIRSFILAKTFAKARGYKICIDGITVDKLKYLNRTNLDCDLLKIVWHPSFVEIINEDKHFMDYVNKAERAKIILCRIDDANAIETGNSLGINLYQGRYVQRLLNASLSKR